MTALHTTLDAIEAYAPARAVSVEEMAGRLGLNRHQTRMFRRVHGLSELREDPAELLLDMLAAPAERVLRAAPGQAAPGTAAPGTAAPGNAVRYLIYAHTIQSVAPADVDVAGELAARLGLHAAEAFALTQQNCATGLAALDLAGELLRADGDPAARALVVTGEKAFSRLAQLVENTTIMGEAATACIVGLDGPGLRIRSYVARTEGQHSDIFRPSQAS